MSEALSPLNPDLGRRLYRMFREFFARAEKKRRWSLEDDIPWGEANKALDPKVANVVESFCAVELYLPDFVAKALPMIRRNRGWAWFHINWGYEESKHSMALEDWLVKSGHRSEEQMEDTLNTLFAHEWDLPQDSPSGMVIYAMVQELATFVSYKRLRNYVESSGDRDPALEKVLRLLATDERTHYDYYRRFVALFLELDRDETLEQMKRVFSTFQMPALGMLADTKQRQAEILELNIFGEQVFLEEVYYPAIRGVGVTRAELRGRRPKKSSPAASLA